MKEMQNLIDTLSQTRSLSLEEYASLIQNRNADLCAYAAQMARKKADAVYGKDIFVRGLIEFSNICTNDCYYCGIRRSAACSRYRLSKEDILLCAQEGYELGFRTFVLQSGEDPYFDDDHLCDIVSSIHQTYPDCDITLSVGQREKSSYQRLYQAGARRYLLRHETANKDHYQQLHPSDMSFDARMQCIQDLRDIGFYVGVGMMVGSPFQRAEDLAKDLKFIEAFQPEMCGIGPFIPSQSTPFRDYPAGSLELTCFLLSLIRLIRPNILLPATTALGSIDPQGREKGIMAGANVIMPNLSPVSVRKKYQLYDNKICLGDESAQCRHCLERRMHSIGYRIVCDVGRIRPWKEGNCV